MLKQTLVAAGAIAVLALSNVAAVQAQQSSAHTLGMSDGQVISTTPHYSKSMQDLQRAAQQLRESIQSLAQQAPGAKREQALRSAYEALLDTQQAMIQLPPELRNSTAGQRAASSRAAAPHTYKIPVAGSYDEAMRHLQHAADRLRNSVQDMAQQPALDRRNQAMKEAREALIETQTAMVWLPNEPYFASGQAASSESVMKQGRSGISPHAGSGAMGGSQSYSASNGERLDTDVDAVAGGVGINARARLSDHAAPDHNVKMVFSLNTGNYLADVNVQVRDSSGRTVIDGVSHGPWLYARLPAGRYTATATYGGESVSETFTVGSSGQRTAHFRWPASVEMQASASQVTPILGTGPQQSQQRY